MKSRTAAFLKPYELSTVDWVLLGTLYDTKSNLNSTEIALMLDVEPPFITEVSRKLIKKDLMEFVKDERDGRVKYLHLSEKGKKLVEEIEPLLQKESKQWFKGAGINEILNYIEVLRKTADEK